MVTTNVAMVKIDTEEMRSDHPEELIMIVATELEILAAVIHKETLSKLSYTSGAVNRYMNMSLVNGPSSQIPGLATSTPKASASLCVVNRWISNCP